MATITPLSEQLKSAMIAANVWQPDCPVPLDRLSLISEIQYVDFSGLERDNGELVVLDVVAHSVESLFAQLFVRRFPIARMRLMHHYNGNDVLSMEDNNTSCFCHRPIEGSLMPSMHSYGVAIDINPLQNPFVTFEPGHEHNPIIQPKAGWQYLNRHNQKPGMVEDAVLVFSRHGFNRWGGSWTTPIDFHHFEIPMSEVQALLAFKAQLP